jgi:hypothetical protein
VGEVEDLRAIGALVGELFRGGVRVGDEGGAVELVVVVGERVAAGAGLGPDATIKVVSVAGGVRVPSERAIEGGEVAVRIVVPGGDEAAGLGGATIFREGFLLVTQRQEF